MHRQHKMLIPNNTQLDHLLVDDDVGGLFRICVCAVHIIVLHKLRVYQMYAPASKYDKFYVCCIEALLDCGNKNSVIACTCRQADIDFKSYRQVIPFLIFVYNSNQAWHDKRGRALCKNRTQSTKRNPMPVTSLFMPNGESAKEREWNEKVYEIARDPEIEKEKENIDCIERIFVLCLVRCCRHGIPFLVYCLAYISVSVHWKHDRFSRRLRNFVSIASS